MEHQAERKQSAAEESAVAFMEDKSSPSSACCSHCGRHDFVSDAEAAVHDASCGPGAVGNPKGPWKCVTCGKNTFKDSSGFSSHRLSCRSGVMKGASVSLRPACLESKRILLSDFNFQVTESIELIEVSPEDIKRFSLGKRRMRQPKVGDIGIRCRL